MENDLNIGKRIKPKKILLVLGIVVILFLVLFFFKAGVVDKRDSNTTITGLSVTDINKMSYNVTKFSGNTTDFDSIEDPTNVSEIILDEPTRGTIKWTKGGYNVINADFDRHVDIGKGYAYVDSASLDASIDSEAEITLEDIHYVSPVIYRDNLLCSECDITFYADGVLTFIVPGFSNYTVGSNTNLSIWDDTDTLTKYTNEQVKFFANYANITSNESINGSGIYCEFSENSTGSWPTPVNMTFNDTSGLYELNESFSSAGDYAFNVSCYADAGFDNLSVTDGFSISPDVLAPSITFESPTPDNGSTVNVSTQTIVANISDPEGSNTSSWIDFDRSLIGYWSMDYYNDSGIYDNSTYNNFGTFNGGLSTSNLITGVRGQGLEFDGVDDYIDSGNDTSLNLANGSDFTLAAWVNVRGNSSGGNESVGSIVGKGFGYYWLAYSNSAHTFLGYTQGNNCYRYSNGSMDFNKWYLVTSVHRNGSVPDTYLDGVLSNSNAYENVDCTNVYSSIPTFIGKGSDSQFIFNGSIDEVMIFNRSLSESEVKALYNSQVNKFNATFNNLSEGQHNYTVYAVDEAGNRNSSNRNFVVDTSLQCGELSAPGVYILTSNVTSNGTCFTITAENVTLDCAGNTITYSLNGADDTHGIYATEYNTTIKNCNIQDGNSTSNKTWRHCIYYYGAGNGRIENNTVNASYGIGLYLFSSNNTLITSNIAKSNTYMGINLEKSSNDTIIDNLGISNTSHGVELYSSCNNDLLINNTGISNTNVAIYVNVNSVNNTLMNNTGISEASAGIQIESQNNTLINNNGTSNSLYGICLLNAINSYLTSNIGTSNSSVGIYLTSSTYNNLTNNTGISVSGLGIYLKTAYDNTLTNNTGISNASDGIDIETSSNNDLINNSGISNAGAGIILDESPNNTLTSNFGSSITKRGIMVSYSNNSILIDNTGTSVSLRGIQLSLSSNCILINNTAISDSETGMYVYGSSDNIIINNTMTSNSSNAAVMQLSTNNSLSRNKVTGYVGYYFVASNYTTISDCVQTSGSNYDIFSDLTIAINITLINCSYNLSKEYIGNESSSLIRQWYFDANVSNTSGIPVEDANVTVYNSSGEIVFSVLTDSSGNVNRTIITEYVNTGGNRTYETPHTVNVSKSGYMTNSSSFNISSSTNTEANIILGEISAQDCGIISTPGTYTLTSNVISDGTCFTIATDNVTLDCQGYNINYSASTKGYGINNSAGYDNLVVRNCNIVKGNNTGWASYAHAIYIGYGIDYAYNNVIINTNITMPLMDDGEYSSGLKADYARNLTLNNVSIDIIGTGTWSNTVLYFEGGQNITVDNSLLKMNQYDLDVVIFLDAVQDFRMHNTTLISLHGSPFKIYGYYDYDIDQSNTDDGYPVLYNHSISDKVVLSDSDFTGIYGVVICGGCNNVTYRNITLSGDGLSLFGTSNSLIENITVSAVNGTALWITGSDNNYFHNLALNISSENSYGMFMDSSNNNNFTGISLHNSMFITMFVISAQNNIFRNYNFSTNSSIARILLYNANHTYTNGTSGSTFYLTGASNVDVYDSTINSLNNHVEFYNWSVGDSRINFYNTTFNKNISILFQQDNASAYFYDYVDVNVTDGEDMLPYVNLSARDRFGTWQSSSMTDGINLARLTLLTSTYNYTDNVTYNNYTINASLLGYSNWTSINVTNSSAYTGSNQVLLGLETDNTPPTILIYSPSNNSFIKSVARFDANISDDVSNTYAFINDSSLVGYWTFDATNSTGVMDSSGKNNFGTFNGNLSQSNLFQGVFGQGMNFDGVDDFINLSNTAPSLSNFDAITISAWVNVPPSPGDPYRVIGKQGTGGSDTFSLFLEGDHPLNFYSETAIPSIVNSSSSVPKNSWQHVTVTYNKSMVSFYINGALDSSVAMSGGLVYSSPTQLSIGRAGGYNFGYLNGSIDELMVFNRSLSSDEVQALYNSSAQKFNVSYTLPNVGVNNVQLVAVDEAGNMNSSYLTLNNDLVAPNITFESPTPDDGSTVNVSTQTIVANISDPEGSNTSSWIDFDRSLVGYWAMDYYNDTGIYDNSTWNNFCNYTGGLSSSDISQGIRGQSIAFDGADDALDCGNNSLMNNFSAITISAWIKSTDGPYIEYEGHIAGKEGVYKIDLSNDRHVRFLTGNNWSGTILSSLIISNNVWIHVVATYDGYTKIIYINGIPDVNLSTSGILGTTSNNITIGTMSETRGHFNGSIDEVMLFNRALSQSEVKSLYDSKVNKFNATFNNLSEGQHNYTVYAIDEAGNLNASSRTFDMDDPYVLTNCTTISTPGNYSLQDNVTSDATCFWINADDVTLDCNGYRITYSLNGQYGTYGIYTNRNGTKIKNCDILDGNTSSNESWRHGVYYYNASNGSIEYIYVNVSYGRAIELYSSSDNTLDNNTFVSDAGIGMHLYASSDNLVINNTVISNSIGIYLESSSDNNTLIDNLGNSTGDYDWGNAGIRVEGSSYNNLTNNYGTGYNNQGIFLFESANNNVLSDNIGISNDRYGIHFASYSNNNTLMNNTGVSDSEAGIYIYSSSDNLIVNNTGITNGNVGIYLESSSDNNTLIGNTGNSTGEYVWGNAGIKIEGSSNNNLTDNIGYALYNRGIFIYSGSDNNVLISNTAISTSQAGIMVYSTSNTTLFRNIGVSVSDTGIYAGTGFNNNLTDNTAISNSTYGIYIEYLNNSVVYGNNATSTEYRGMLIYNSSGCVVKNNIASANAAVGLFVSSCNDLIFENNTGFSNSSYGLYLEACNNNNVTNNTGISNTYRGIVFSSSSNNSVIGNNGTGSNVGIILDANSSNNILINNIGSSLANGIYIYAQADNNILIGNTVTGENGYVVDGSNNTFISDCVYTSGSTYDILIGSGIGWEYPFATSINCTYNISKEAINPGMTLVRQWYFDLNVTNGSGSPVEGANVTVYNTTGGVAHTALTNSSGEINRTIITEYVNIGGNRTYESPHTVNVSKDRYITNSSSYNLSVLNNVISTIVLYEYSDITPPSITFEPPTPENGSTVNVSTQTIVANISDESSTSSWIDFDRSLVGYWSMDYYNDSGIYDNSTYNNFGTFGGGLGTNNLVQSNRGLGLDFDGVDDYVKINRNFTENSMTISCWVYARSAFMSGWNPQIIFDKSWGDFGIELVHFNEDNYLYFNVYNGTNITSTSTVWSGIPMDEWNSIVAVADTSAKEIRLYLNGELYSENNYTGNIDYGDDSITLGSYYFGSSGFFNGSIDEVMIFNRSLSESEINALYNSQSNKFNATFNNLSEGQHNYTIYAIDKAGNLNSSGERNFDVDTSLKCGELSTAGDTYTLTSNVSSNGTCFTITAENVTLDCNGNWINYSTAGESLNYGIYTNQFNTTIKNCNVIDGNLTSIETGRYGIYFNGNDNSTLQNNFVNVSGNLSIAIALDNSPNFNQLINNTGISYYDKGIYLYDALNNTLVNNTAISYTNAGILITYSSNNVLSDFTGISYTQDWWSQGITLEYSNNNILNNSIGTSSTGIGIGLAYSSNNTLINSIGNATSPIDHNGNSVGIFLAFSDYNTIIDSIAQGDANYGIRFDSSTFNNITDTRTLSNNSEGLGLLNSSYNTMTNVSAFSNTEYGMIFSPYWDGTGYSYNNTIINCTIRAQETWTVMFLQDSSNNTFIGNTISSGDAGGTLVYLTSNATRNIFYWNNFTDTTGSYIYDENGSNYYNATINGKNEGNIWFNALNGDVNITGSVNSSYGNGFYIGSSGSKYPYNGTNSGGKVTANVVDYAPLTMNYEEPLDCGVLGIAGSTYTLTSNVTSDGTCFTITADNVTLDCNGYWITYSLNGADDTHGIYTTKYNSTVKNCNIQDGNWTSNQTWRHCIYYYGADNGRIENNTVNASYGIGLYLYSSNSTLITSNIAMSNTYMGINLEKSSNDTITDNLGISNTSHGVELYSSCNNNLLINNTGVSNTNVAIYINVNSVNNTLINNTGISDVSAGIQIQSDNNTLINNNGTSNSLYGICILSAINSYLTSNIGTSNSSVGIYLTSSTYNNLTNNTGISISGFGMYLNVASNNVLMNNTAYSNANYSIYMYNSLNNTLIGNRGTSNLSKAIYLYASSDNYMINNTGISITNPGIYLISLSNNNTLINNTGISNSSSGILIYSSNNNTLINNYGTSNSSVGINVFNSTNCSIANNTGTSRTNVAISISTSSNNNLLMNNIGTSISGQGIYLLSSSNNTLTGNNGTSESNYGIILDSSTNNTLISNAGTSNSNTGIDIYNSSNNTLEGNNGTSDSGQGIRLDLSVENHLAYNTGTSNSSYGILFTSTNNTVLISNTGASNSSLGIYLYKSSSNNLTSNDASGLRAYYFVNSSYNRIVDCGYTNGSASDIYVESPDYSLNNTFINCSYNVSKEEVYGTSNYILRQWYFDANVTNSSGSPVDGANLSIYNSTGAVIYTELTNTSGNINRTTITEYLNTGGTRAYATPHTVNISKTGYITNSSSINISSTQNTQANIILSEEPPNTPSTITSIASIGSIDPIESSQRVIEFNFTVDDAQGNDTINVSSAQVIVNNSGIIRQSNAGSCTGTPINDTAQNISCNISLQYYDPAGVWSVNISIEDTMGSYTTDISTTFTYNMLYAVALNTNLLDFGALNAGDVNKTAGILVLNNTGNFNYSSIQLKAFNLVNESDILAASNFRINITNVSLGNVLSNNTFVNITGAMLSRSTDYIVGNQSMYIYVDVPLGTAAKKYTSSSEWILSLS